MEGVSTTGVGHDNADTMTDRAALAEGAQVVHFTRGRATERTSGATLEAPVAGTCGTWARRIP